MSIKLLRSLLPVMLMTLLLGGCGYGVTLDPSLLATGEGTRTRISMSWWGNDTRHSYTLDGLMDFEAKNPDVEVRHRYGVWNGYEKRQQVMMESHTECDVMQINFAWISKYSSDGTRFYDLSELSDEIDLTSYTEEDLRLGTVDGHLNALPISYNASTFWYNATLYGKYGLKIPETWEDLFAAADLMRADGIYPLGTEKKQLFLMLNAWYTQRSGHGIVGEDGRLAADAEGLKEILDFYKELTDRGVLPPVGQFSTSDFESQKCAGALCWISDSTRYCSYLSDSGIEVALGTPLTCPDALAYGWYVKPSTLYAISGITDHPEEAGRLLNYLVNDGDMALLQGTEKGIPVSTRAREALLEADQLNGFEHIATELLDENRSRYLTMLPQLEDADVISAFKDASDKYLYGQAGIKEAAAEIASGVSELLG